MGREGKSRIDARGRETSQRHGAEAFACDIRTRSQPAINGEQSLLIDIDQNRAILRLDLEQHMAVVKAIPDAAGVKLHRTRGYAPRQKLAAHESDSRPASQAQFGTAKTADQGAMRKVIVAVTVDDPLGQFGNEWQRIGAIA